MKFRTLVLVVLSLLVLFAGCNNELVDTMAQVQVEIIIQAEEGVITPQSELTLRGARSGSKAPIEEWPVFAQGSVSSVMLTPGTWSLQLKAMEEGMIRASGERELTVGAGKMASVVFFLRCSSDIHFDSNGGTDLQDVTKTVDFGSPYGQLPSTSRTGYTFSGWYTEVDGGNLITDETIMRCYTQQTLYAHWTANEYTVVFDKQGGAGGSDESVVMFGSTLPELLTAPTKPGFQFAGYYDQVEDGVQYYDSAMQGRRDWERAGDATLYARWALDAYEVVYEAGQDGGGLPPQSQIKFHDIDLVLRNGASLERYGHYFDGWNTQSDGAGILYAPGSLFTANHDLTLYAQWAANTYEVVYEIGEISGGLAPQPQIKLHDVDLEVRSGANLEKHGYHFDGWNTQADGSGTSYAPGSFIAENDDVVLYAQWAPNTYGVTFDKMGGAGGSDEAIVVFDASLPLSLVAPTRPGFQFVGYYDQVENGIVYYDSGMHSLRTWGMDRDATLYARWALDTYEVVYKASEASSGMPPLPQIKTHDVKLVLRNWASLERHGYHFAGWNTKDDRTGTLYAPGSFFEGNHDLILYAQWGPNTYEVTFDKRGGGGGPDRVVTQFDSPLEDFLVAPERTGYDFIGYYDRPVGGDQYYDEQMNGTRDWDIAEATTLYAQWRAKEYTLSFNGMGGESPANQVVIYDALYGQLPIPAREGYSFTGWYTVDGGDLILPTTVVSRPYDHTLSADWTIKKYSITYHANGAQQGSAPQAQLKTHGIDHIVLGNEKSLGRSGYSLAGWSTRSDGSGAVYEPGDVYDGDEATNFYPVWSANSYTVSFDGTGGSSPEELLVLFDGEYGPLPLPEREGYNFVGWYADDHGGHCIDDREEVSIVGDHTLYAHWSLKQYAVTFDPNGADDGVTPAWQYKTHGVPLVLSGNSGNLGQQGYEFAGWNSEADGSGSTYGAGDVYSINEELVLYAQWSRVYAIGDIGPAGGWIFYDKGEYSDGWRYLEAAAEDLKTHLWGYTGELVTGTAIGDGRPNTVNVMVDEKEHRSGYMCNALEIEYEGVIFDDWFLPSKDELMQMYVNLKVPKLGNFQEAVYWSSSVDAWWSVWTVNFRNGAENGTNRNGYADARPIRQF